MQSHSYENDFDLHENETACRTHFHMKGFALRLVLKQRHKRNSEMVCCAPESVVGITHEQNIICSKSNLVSRAHGAFGQHGNEIAAKYV